MDIARDRLKTLLQGKPDLTVKEAVDTLGVSRQRLHQVCKSEGIKLRDARVRVVPTLAHKVVKSPHEGRTFSLKASGCISELIVAVDLLERGFDVYKSLTVGGLCDLVAVNRESGATLRFEVKTARLSGNGKPVFGGAQNNRYDVLVLVLPGREIRYEPNPFG